MVDSEEKNDQASVKERSLVEKPPFTDQIEVLATRFVAGDQEAQAQVRQETDEIIQQLKAGEMENAFDYVGNQLHIEAVTPEDRISPQDQVRYDFLREVRNGLLDRCFALGKAGRSIIASEAWQDIFRELSDSEQGLILEDIANVEAVARLIFESIADCENFHQVREIARDSVTGWLREKFPPSDEGE